MSERPPSVSAVEHQLVSQRNAAVAAVVVLLGILVLAAYRLETLSSRDAQERDEIVQRMTAQEMKELTELHADERALIATQKALLSTEATLGHVQQGLATFRDALAKAQADSNHR